MSLIKTLNDKLKPVDIVEQAFDNVDKESEMRRIADHWKQELSEHPYEYGILGDGTISDRGERNIADKIGNDLEQLEYSPEEVDQMVPHIIDLLYKELSIVR